MGQVMTPNQRRDTLKSLFPQYPGWHSNSTLPFLISLANSIDEESYRHAVAKLLAGSMIELDAISNHENLRVLKTLRSLSWTKAEIKTAIRKAEGIPSHAQMLPRTALRIAFSGGQPTAQTMELLALLAKEIDPI